MLDTLRPPSEPLESLKTFARSAYGLEGHWKPLEGERDQNHRVTEASGAQWVFKLFNSNEPETAIVCQAEALEHIATTDPGLAVPRLRRSLTGAAASEWVIDGRRHQVMVLSYLPGAVVGNRELSADKFYELGQLVARLGKALRGFVSPAPAQRKLVWDNRHILDLRPFVESIPDNLRPAARGLLDHFAQYMKQRLAAMRSQIIHGDVHPYNCLMDDAGNFTGVIDFGDLVHATLVQDAANCIADFLQMEKAIDTVLYSTTRGYCSITPLDEEELDLLLDMIAIRLLMTPLVDAAKRSEGCPVQDYLATAGDRCLPLLEQIDARREELVNLIRRAGNFPPRKAVTAQSVDALMASRQRHMGAKPYMFYDPPIHMIRGEGVWLFDDNGRRYLDCYNNVPHVGHCHPYVVAAIARQAARLNTNTRYITDESLEYAERLTATMDKSLTAVVFVNSGSEANDVAWRMAKAWTAKRGGLAMDFAYHGITEAIDAFSPSNAPETWNAPHIRLLPPPDDYRGPYLRGDSEFAAKYAALADQPIAELDRVGFGLAATMIDAAFMTNGMLDVPEGYLHEIVRKTRAAGGLYIADEVQSGFGRMGTAMWGHQHHGIVPDFVTIGKPAGNGHPIGVVVTRPEILEHFTALGPFFSTFGGNNVSCAAGIAVLDVIRDEDLVTNVRDTGAYLRNGLRGLMAKHPIIGDVRGCGLAVGIELVTDRKTKTPAHAVVKPLLNLLRDEGILAGSEGKLGNIIKIRPPTVFKKVHADMAVAALDRALSRL